MKVGPPGLAMPADYDYGKDTKIVFSTPNQINPEAEVMQFSIAMSGFPFQGQQTSPKTMLWSEEIKRDKMNPKDLKYTIKVVEYTPSTKPGKRLPTVKVEVEKLEGTP